jgi:general secretion pathway protein F
MVMFRYRAVMADGLVTAGEIDALDMGGALAGLRRNGARPIEVLPISSRKRPKQIRSSSKKRAAVVNLVGELSVLLKAGLPLDRALGLAISNVEDEGLVSDFETVLASVREGTSLSRAMLLRPDLFSPVASAMAEAGEANGQLAPALARLSQMLEQAEDLRKLVVTSMIYPIALIIIAVGVILMMLLAVVPQFESLFATAQGKLPAASEFVMAASRFVRSNKITLLLGTIGVAFGIRYTLARPASRLLIDRLMLHLPQVGTLVRYIETARFARTLGVLVEGEVPLPNAVALARRTIGNHVISDAVDQVAGGLKEGSGLTAPLAAANVLPKMAIGFLRTGEETSQLGLMLDRLADVLDRDVKIRLERLIGILTPMITVILGATVAAIIASIMTAITGFNDLALSQ